MSIKPHHGYADTMKKESDPVSASGEITPSRSEGIDHVSGKKNEPDEYLGINEGNVATNDNSRYLYASDELPDETEKHEKPEIMGKYMLNKRKMKEKRYSRKPSQKFEGNMVSIVSDYLQCIPSTMACAISVFLRLLYYQLSFTATKKKECTLILCMFVQYMKVASGSPQHPTMEPNVGFEYKILDASKCGRIGFLKPNQCERNEKLFQIFIDFCGLDGKCDPGFKPTCAQGDSDDVVHFCSPENLTCKAGFERKARIKNKDIVIVTEEKCPNGRYQPFESDCYRACVHNHGNMKELPDQYAVYYDGDHVSPPLLYCDYKKGFYSSQGTFLYRYDDEMRHKIFECTNVNEYNPCTDEMFPLPDGSCVSPCQPGYSRDVHDDFKCKKVLNVGLPMDTSKNTNKKDDDESETLQEKLEVNENEPEVITTTPSQNWHVTVVIVMVVFALLFTVSSIVIIYNT